MPNKMTGLLQDPTFMLGAGILANNTGHYGAFGPAFGAGVYQAGQAQRQNQLFELERQKQLSAQRKMQKAADGRYRYVDTGELVYPGVTPQNTPTTDYKNYLNTTNNPTPQGFANWLLTGKKAGATRVSQEMKTTAPERKAAGRSSRIEQAENEIQTLASQGNDVLSIWDKMVTNYTPDVLQSIMRSDTGNRIAAAQNSWIQTHGRAESGAAINKDEWPMWRETYFPQPGEDEYTKQMKARARQGVREGLTLEAGRAFMKQSGVRIPAIPPKEKLFLGKYSDEDIKYTAKQEGITVEQVKQRLKGLE